MLEKLLINREMVSRGETALFYDFERSFSEEEREVAWESMWMNLVACSGRWRGHANWLG